MFFISMLIDVNFQKITCYNDNTKIKFKKALEKRQRKVLLEKINKIDKKNKKQNRYP